MLQHRSLSFIGAGNIVNALLAGLSAAAYPMPLITVAAPSATHRDPLAKTYGVTSTDNNLLAAKTAAVIVVAVKPLHIAVVCQTLATCDLSGKLILSLVAGVTLEHYAQLLGGDHHNIIRVMPNTPALIGQGMTGLYAPPQVSQRHRTFAATLLQMVGHICWVPREHDINTVIAAAGSAPAYFFFFMQVMQQTAVSMGLDSTSARRLVQQAMLGAAQMAISHPQLSLQTLGEQVTSKGGTTAAALQVFHQQQFSITIAEAMRAAVFRAEAIQQ